MEVKESKILFNKGGSGGYTSRVTLPINWLKQLNVDIDNKDVKITFDGKKITIESARGRSL